MNRYNRNQTFFTLQIKRQVVANIDGRTVNQRYVLLVRILAVIAYQLNRQHVVASPALTTSQRVRVVRVKVKVCVGAQIGSPQPSACKQGAASFKVSTAADKTTRGNLQHWREAQGVEFEGIVPACPVLFDGLQGRTVQA